MSRRPLVHGPVGTAIMWSVLGLIVLSPVLIAGIQTNPEWYTNVPFWLVVIIPGVGGALAFGPAWYYRRRKLLRQELKASGRGGVRP